MENNMEKIMEVVMESEELSEKLRKVESVDELIAFYRSVDGSLTEDEILDYLCSKFGLDETVENIDDILESVNGGKIDPKNKFLASALGALTVISATGATPSVGAKGFDSAKNAVVSAGQKVKGGFTKAGQTIKNKWNGLTKKQKIALAASTATAVVGIATIGGVIAHKHHKENQAQKPKPDDAYLKGDSLKTEVNKRFAKDTSELLTKENRKKIEELTIIRKEESAVREEESRLNEINTEQLYTDNSRTARYSRRLDTVLEYLNNQSSDSYNIAKNYNILRKNFNKDARTDTTALKEIENKIKEVKEYDNRYAVTRVFVRAPKPLEPLDNK